MGVFIVSPSVRTADKAPPCSGYFREGPGLPIPRKQLGQLALRLAGDAGVHVGQPCLRVDVAKFCGSNLECT